MTAARKGAAFRTADFLQFVLQNAARVRRYALGGDGSGGMCDCVGLVIGAVRLTGRKWPGKHGSNYAARRQTRNLGPIQSAAALREGMLVYKGRAPGDAGYALPAAYASGGDLTDYYHIGVVTSLHPLTITHCTSVSGGIKRDNALGAWRYAGTLALLDDDETGDDPCMTPLYQARVTAANGLPVRLREKPSLQAAVLRSVPLGEMADVLEETGDWARVRCQGTEGYMMRRFLDEPTAAAWREKAQAALLDMKDALDRLEAALLEADA